MITISDWEQNTEEWNVSPVFKVELEQIVKVHRHLGEDRDGVGSISHSACYSLKLCRVARTIPYCVTDHWLEPEKWKHSHPMCLWAVRVEKERTARI